MIPNEIPATVASTLTVLSNIGKSTITVQIHGTALTLHSLDLSCCDTNVHSDEPGVATIVPSREGFDCFRELTQRLLAAALQAE